MTRIELGAVARDLAGDRSRAAMLARVVSGTTRRALPIEALTVVPAWLRVDASTRRDIARRAALVGIAPEIVRSIDGAWLGGLAKVAGDAAIDWAARQPVPQRLDAFDGTRLDAVGAGIIRAATPTALHDYVDAGESDIAPGAAAALIEHALTAAMQE